MSSISADNQDLTTRVALIRGRYQGFQQALRGATADLLTGLMNGTVSLLRLSSAYDQLAADLRQGLRHQCINDLFTLSLIAQKTASDKITEKLDSRVLAISETLQNGFRDSLDATFESLALRDVQIAEQFVRKQLYQGRAVATTAELSLDLQFRHTDRGGRQISSEDLAFREVNWAYRQHYNTLMTYMLMSAGVDDALVDGGSKAGELVELAQYDKVGPTYFHHNSAALLQPMEIAVKDDYEGF